MHNTMHWPWLVKTDKKQTKLKSGLKFSTDLCVIILCVLFPLLSRTESLREWQTASSSTYNTLTVKCHSKKKRKKKKNTLSNMDFCLVFRQPHICWFTFVDQNGSFLSRFLWLTCTSDRCLQSYTVHMYYNCGCLVPWCKTTHDVSL